MPIHYIWSAAALMLQEESEELHMAQKAENTEYRVLYRKKNVL